MSINNFTKIKLLFFDNIGIKQTILKNTFWLAIAEGISQLLKTVLIIYVVRILGATEYGRFAFALAFVSIFGIFADFGLSFIVTREFSREREGEREFPALLSLKFLLSLGTLILIFVGSFFITPDPIIQKIICILAIVTLLGSFSDVVYAFFRARQKMEYEALTKIFQTLVLTIIGFFVILNYPSIENLSYSYLIAGLIALIFILIFFHFKVFPLKFSFKRTIWRNFLAMSWPIGLSIIFNTFYSHFDSIIMGYLGQITQIGWYNAPYKIINLVFVLPTLIYLSFYPVLSVAFRETKEKLQRIWNYHMEIMILLSVPLIIGGITFASRIINSLYPGFTPSVLAFQILIIMAGVVFLSNPFHQILIISNQQKKLCQINFYGAIVNIILNLILIPRFSLYGAAVSILVTWLLILFLFFYFTSKFTSISPFNLRFFLIFIIAIFSSLIMHFVMSQSKIYNFNFFLLISIGTGIYLFFFFIFKKLISHFSKI